MAIIQLPLEPLVLSIGFDQEPGPELDVAPTTLDLEHSRLSPETLCQIAPDHVVSWLFCARYDAYDVAHLLTKAQFRGTYHAVAAHLPKKALVTREIRACFPGLDFRLVCPAVLSRRAAVYHGFVANAGTQQVPVLA